MNKTEFFERMGIQSAEVRKRDQIREAREEFDITLQDGKVYIVHNSDAILDVTDKPMDEIKALVKSMQDTLVKWRGLD